MQLQDDSTSTTQQNRRSGRGELFALLNSISCVWIERIAIVTVVAPCNLHSSLSRSTFGLEIFLRSSELELVNYVNNNTWDGLVVISWTLLEWWDPIGNWILKLPVIVANAWQRPTSFRLRLFRRFIQTSQTILSASLAAPEDERIQYTAEHHDPKMHRVSQNWKGIRYKGHVDFHLR